MTGVSRDKRTGVTRDRGIVVLWFRCKDVENY